MTDLSAELVQRLARRKVTGEPVLSLYLSVDGREAIRVEDYRLRVDGLLKSAAIQNDGLPGLSSIIERVHEFFHEQTPSRKDIRGVALFASTDELWEVIPLTVPVEDHLAVNSSPHVRQLEILLDEYESMGVLMTDRQHTRMFRIEMDRIVERREFSELLPRHDDDKGDWRKDHVKTHSRAIGSAHLKNAAHAMFDFYQERPFSRLLVCTTDELYNEVEGNLHNYVKERLAGRSNLPLNASDDQILAAVRETSKAAERRSESVYVDRLRAGVLANEAAGRTNGDSTVAVAGIDKTLHALFEKRVETLLVSDGFRTEGWRCHGCGVISTLGRQCKMCGTEMQLVDDIVEEAVEDALGQRCRVEFCSENADLDVLGRIGALLRF